MDQPQPNIVVVEDDNGMRQTLVFNLEDEGYRVTAFKRGAEALELVRRESPDVVMSDLRLPDASGLDILEALKENNPESCFILMTGHATLETAVEALNEGATAYITKPFKMDTVNTIIRNALRQRRLLLENHRLVDNLQQSNKDLAAEVAERKASQAALQESEEKYRTLFEDSRDAIYIRDLDGWFVDVNQAALDLFGYTRRELLALNISDLCADPDSNEEFRREMACRGSVRDLATRFRKQDGTVLHCLLTAATRRSKDGRVIGYQGIIHDLTERKLLEDQLQQFQKMESIGRLAGGVAHEFNNLLTPMMGYAQFLMTRLPPDDDLRSGLGEIFKASERAANLTRQLLGFSRRQIVEPKVINLSDLLVDVGKMLRRFIGEHIELVVLPAPESQRIKVDPNQIEQILVNLTVNARDAMPEGGKLTIEAGSRSVTQDGTSPVLDLEPGSYAVVMVRDTGTGMSPEALAHAFEPFFTTKEPGKGTGLGLATCYGIVHQIGGHIEVYSQPGRGASFEIYLPLVEEPVDAPQPHEAPHEFPRGAETVLLAEDEPLVRTMTAKILQEQGYTILEAANGGEALRLVEQRSGDQINLLLTDIVMPNMGGIELAEQFNARYPDTPVLLMSGYTDESVSDSRLACGHSGFIQKPFSPAVLTSKVRELLDA